MNKTYPFSHHGIKGQDGAFVVIQNDDGSHSAGVTKISEVDEKWVRTPKSDKI